MKKYSLFLLILVIVFGSFNINKASAVSISLPEGCTSTAGYSPITGQRCYNPIDASGCLPGHQYSPLTGQPCNSTTLPPGCSSTSGYSYLTGQRCDGNSGAPVISGVSGPQALNVGQQGTWTVSAYSTNGQNLSYGVVWGDEIYAALLLDPNSGRRPIMEQSATFTHSYSQAGTYTPTFIVTNAGGQSARTSLSVKVGSFPPGCTSDVGYSSTTGMPCFESALKVLSPNGGETFTAGQQVEVKWETTNIPKNIKNIQIELLYSYLVPGETKARAWSTALLSGVDNYLTVNDGRETVSLPSKEQLVYITSDGVTLPSNGAFYKIVVSTGTYTWDHYTDESDTKFTINSSSTQPTQAPTMVYPQNGQTLNIGGGYMFKVNPVANASGYLFGFFQNGTMIHENQRDLGALSTNGEYAIWPNSPYYNLFKQGSLEVWVRAYVNNTWSEARIINITLANGTTSTGELRGKVCLDANSNGTCDSGESYFRDSSLAGSSPSISGLSITYNGPTSGDTSLNKYSSDTGQPIFSVTGLPVGAYTVKANVPSGYTVTGSQVGQTNGTYLAGPNPATANVPSNASVVVIFAVKANTSANQVPTVSSLSPSSGPVGTQVTITGTNFTSTNNTIKFGGTSLGSFNSSNGTSLTFTATSTSGVGLYQVTVTNANGTSTSQKYFTITESTTATGEIRGKVCKDLNSNGTCDGGSELWLRDLSSTATGCTVGVYEMAYVSVSYTGPVSGTAYANKCSSSTGDPIFSATGLPVGTYTVTLNLPSGYTSAISQVGQTNGTYLAGPNPVTVNVTANGSHVVLFAVK